MTLTPTDANVVANALEQFIREELLYDREELELDRRTHLLQSGYIDSMGIFRMIDFIEQQFDIALQPSEIQVEHFRDIDSICALIQKGIQKGGAR